MKTLLILFSLFFTVSSFGGTCTSDTYTSNSANTVLTSTKYNGDNSTIYNRLAGNFDGGCVVDGTLEGAALNSSEFAVLYNGIHQGCKVTRSDAATVSVDKCILSLNGVFVRTTIGTTATWGCSGCTAESASTIYYLYAKSDSTGTTLNLLISSSAPNTDGFDGSTNKVLAKFYNDAGSDIDQYSIDQWSNNRFAPQVTGSIDGGTATITGTTSDPTKGTIIRDKVRWHRDGRHMVVSFEYEHNAGSPAAGSGSYLLEVPNSSVIDTTGILANTNGELLSTTGSGLVSNTTTGIDDASRLAVFQVYDSTNFYVFLKAPSDTMTVWGSVTLSMSSATIVFSGNNIRVPILGWGE